MNNIIGIRSSLNFHAFTYSFTKTVQYEVLQRQIELLTSVDVMREFSNNIFDINGTLLLENATPLLCLIGLTFYSIKYLNESKIKKLDTISPEYKNTRKMIQASLFIFVHIFFRNVENAI